MINKVDFLSRNFQNCAIQCTFTSHTPIVAFVQSKLTGGTVFMLFAELSAADLFVSDISPLIVNNFEYEIKHVNYRLYLCDPFIKYMHMQRGFEFFVK